MYVKKMVLLDILYTTFGGNELQICIYLIFLVYY